MGRKRKVKMMNRRRNQNLCQKIVDQEENLCNKIVEKEGNLCNKIVDQESNPCNKLVDQDGNPCNMKFILSPLFLQMMVLNQIRCLMRITQTNYRWQQFQQQLISLDL